MNPPSRGSHGESVTWFSNHPGFPGPAETGVSSPVFQGGHRWTIHPSEVATRFSHHSQQYRGLACSNVSEVTRLSAQHTKTALHHATRSREWARPCRYADGKGLTTCWREMQGAIIGQSSESNRVDPGEPSTPGMLSITAGTQSFD